jgi:phage gp46-like protein
MDIALVFDQLTLSADIVVENGGLRMDPGLTTAVIMSLFSDQRADDDDPVDAGVPGGGRKGWAGDLLEPPGRRLGSKLWLLQRAKMQEGGQDTAALVEQYAGDALQWLIDDGVADQVECTARRAGLEAIALAVAISKGGKPLGRWDFAWNAQVAAS